MNRHKALRLLAVVAALAAVTAGPAAAAGGVDQITGNGQTDSAVTASWAQGVLAADNTTVAQPRDATSDLSFMYPDFQNLKVTVSQTQNLVHQSIDVSWTGFPQNESLSNSPNFLQIMQCYGDASTGPLPEDCEFGTAHGLPSQWASGSGASGGRGGASCPGATPSTANPPGDGSGCDTREPLAPSHVDPNNSTQYDVPFVPVDTTRALYGDPAHGGQLNEFFDQYNSNEVQEADTKSDGTGQYFFQTLTAKEASGLGCGKLETTGQPRDCWLVIVPRGQFSPNGYQRSSHFSSPTNWPLGSPLGASNWAQRIQIHLGFAPLTPNCTIGAAQERETVGTELVAHAMFSWQLALNAKADCKTIYGYSAVPEPTNTAQLNDPGGAGLAFTTIPVGGEATRYGSPSSGTGPPLVYAPVAVSAITVGFNVALPGTGGFDPNPVKLTPRLLAKALTQSYKNDLPEYAGGNTAPDWAKNNPGNIGNDPEFTKLNPGVTEPWGSPVAPLLTEDHSAVNQQVWAWILADPAARAWLDGTPDEYGMKVNPTYTALKLGTPPAADSFPRADTKCVNLNEPGEGSTLRCSLDLLPYVNSLDDGAAHVRAADNPEGQDWDPTAVNPTTGQAGWWGKGGIEPSYATFMWTVTDSSSVANYGLVPAQLCAADGTGCVSPDTASVTSALATAKPDGTGLLHIDPATPGSGGYPLVDVTYAAVRTDQSPAALTDFATLLEYAAGPGQAAGVGPGQLPHGYLPLPDDLRTQANGVVATLRADANPTLSNSPVGGNGSAAGNGSNSSFDNPSANNGSGNTVAGNSGTVSGKSGGGPGTVSTGKPAELAAHYTPSNALGALRWMPLAVTATGLLGALVGWLLRPGNVLVGRFLWLVRRVRRRPDRFMPS